MRTPSSLAKITRLAALLALLASSLAAVSSPAVAGAGDTTVKMEMPKGAELVAYLVLDTSGKVVPVQPRIETTPTKQFVVFGVGPQALTCAAYASPVPVYSPNHTLHYGSRAQCSEPVQVRIRNGLFSGPDADSTNTWQLSDPFSYGTGTVWGGDVAPCVDWSDFAWWEMMVWAEVERPWGWATFVPYPARVYSQTGCIDIV